MGRNAEAYVDDIVVKTRESHTFIEDLEETLTKSRPSKKCVLHAISRKCNGSRDAWQP
jgi:hypothetical protein